MRFASLVSVVVLLLISASLVFATNGFQVQEDNLSVLVAVEDGMDFNCFDTETPEHNPVSGGEVAHIEQWRQDFAINSQDVDNYGVTAYTVSQTETVHERTESLTEFMTLLENSSEDTARNRQYEGTALKCPYSLRAFTESYAQSLGITQEIIYCLGGTADARNAPGHRVLKYPSSVLLLV